MREVAARDDAHLQRVAVGALVKGLVWTALLAVACVVSALGLELWGAIEVTSEAEQSHFHGDAVTLALCGLVFAMLSLRERP